jgi:hypothetical protein
MAQINKFLDHIKMIRKTYIHKAQVMAIIDLNPRYLKWMGKIEDSTDDVVYYCIHTHNLDMKPVSFMFKGLVEVWIIAEELKGNLLSLYMNSNHLGVDQSPSLSISNSSNHVSRHSSPSFQHSSSSRKRRS